MATANRGDACPPSSHTRLSAGRPVASSTSDAAMAVQSASPTAPSTAGIKYGRQIAPPTVTRSRVPRGRSRTAALNAASAASRPSTVAASSKVPPRARRTVPSPT